MTNNRDKVALHDFGIFALGIGFGTFIMTAYNGYVIEVAILTGLIAAGGIMLICLVGYALLPRIFQMGATS